MKKNDNKYKTGSIRLKNWDYGSKVLYFITICTKDRECSFGNVNLKNDLVQTQNLASLSHHIQQQNMVETENFLSLRQTTATLNTGTQNIAFPPAKEPLHRRVQLQATEIGSIAGQYWEEIPKHFPFVELYQHIVMPNHVHGILFFKNKTHKGWVKNRFGPQSGNLGAVIRGYKAGVTAYATKNNIPFGLQTRYHEHIIRNNEDFLRISNYIITNLANWHTDKFFK